MRGGSVLKFVCSLSSFVLRLSAAGALIALLAACAAPPPPPLPTIPPAPTLASLAPTVGTQVAPVAIDTLTTYAHPSGVVTLQVPAGWALRDASRPDEVSLAWLDPTRNGGLLLSVFEDPNPYTDGQLGDVLSGFLTRSYGDLPLFRADAPMLQPDGTVRMGWGYTAATADGDVPLAAVSVISQNGNKVAILSMLVPETQATALNAAIETLLTGYSLNPAAPLIP